METPTEKHTAFPKFLPRPDENVLKWVGEHLKNSRGKKTASDIAKAAKVKIEVIEQIEGGVIHQDLGQLRHILQRGYGRKLEDILAKCHDTFKDHFNATGKRRFDRDYYYSICLTNEGKKAPTPFLVGGDPENFLWAVPIRKLKNQPLCVDLLELAPKRKKRRLGETPPNSHDGVEVIHVIKGTVEVTVDTGADDPPGRTLKAGDSIHFNSHQEHQISNDGNTTPALLLVVRCQKF